MSTFETPYLTEIPSTINVDEVETDLLNVIADGLSKTVTNPGHINLRASTGNSGHFRTYISTDALPCISLETFAHDNMALNFDCHYSSAWTSSDPGSNFQLYKHTDGLRFNASGGVTEGSTITWTTAMRITPSGVCYFNTAPFVGADNVVVQSSATNTVTSTGAIAHSFQIDLRKMGTTVIARLRDISISSNTTATSTVVVTDIIPAGYVPQDSFTVFGTATYNGTAAMVRVDVTNNDITIRRIINGASEPVTNGTFTFGFAIKGDPVQMTWLTAS